MFPTPRTVPTAAASRSRTTRLRRVGLAVAIALLAAGACKNTATNPGDLLGIAGTYRLVSVNASTLPFPDGNLFVVRGSLVIHSNPRYELTETDSAAGATSDVTSSGQWNVSNNALVLKGDDGSFYFGTLTGGRDSVLVQLGTHLGTYVR